MKILHCCLSCFYIDSFTYQENMLVREHVDGGHDVFVLASTEIYNSNGKLSYTIPSRYLGNDGAEVLRIPYVGLMPHALMKKIRAYENVYKHLDAIKPDVIIFHGLCSWSLLTVSSYVRKNPYVKLIVDCHEDSNNSARTWASRVLLHQCFYKLIFRRCLNQITKVLCITIESMDFALNFYGSPRAKTSLFPLGCTLETSQKINKRRASFRTYHAIKDTDVVITQTGKLDYTKQLEATLYAFCANSAPNLKLVIAGKMTDDVSAVCLPLIKSDPRILNLGWQTPDELRTVLAGVDCFLQPFGQTVTTQMAMGYGCVIMAQDLASHRWLVGDSNFLFKDATELPSVFKKVLENQARLDQLKKSNSEFAATHLDYKKLALQIIN